MLFTNCIVTTRGGITRVYGFLRRRNGSTSRSIRITSVSSGTCTSGAMRNDLAIGIGGASARARISTLLLSTCQITGTVWIDETFRPTIGRHSNVSWFACTSSSVSISDITIGVRSTRCGIARVNWFLNYWFDGRSWSTSDKWITNVSMRTLTKSVVTDNLTSSVDTTNVSSARIDTLVIDTCCGEATLRTDNTFWAAVGRVANVTWKTRADTVLLLFVLLTIGSARVRITRVCFDWFDRRGKPTGFQGVTSVSWGTTANGVVSHNSAIGTSSTRSWAGISTALGHTSLVIGTVIVDLTFRLAFYIGIAKVVGRTLASSVVSPFFTECILTTRIRAAGISFNRLNWWWLGQTLGEGITNEVIRARADGIVVDNVTLGSNTTSSHTGISTLLLNTSFVGWTFSVDHTFRAAVGWWANVSW